MSQIWDAIKTHSGPVLLGFGALGLIATLFLLFKELIDLSKLAATGAAMGASLPLLAIGGVIVLILLLTVVAMIFSVLGITNKDQAMGLPEGSIRAVIALSLIVLFAILSVFLYQGVSTSGPRNVVENLSETERAQFLKDHTAVRDLQAVAVTKDGKTSYNVSYRSVNAASDDFAKQLLVLLGTLMTAITSFYLGAGTATSAATAAKTADEASSPPAVTSIDPVFYKIDSENGAVIHLRIMGSNLNAITHVKIVRGGVQVAATNVASNPTSVTCDIAASAATTPPGAPWDVVVDDGGKKSARLPGALTIA